MLSILTDGIFLLLHLPRKQLRHKPQSFDPEKLTVLIACYNGQDIIGDTITDALVHVKPEQIIVISDYSTDKTAQTAREYGVRVVENERNLNKAFSISFAMKHVKTPYVLILDDDTLIGKTFIPTSLLDEGYDAVAFNVMPLETGTLVNKLQIFEYRKSMIMGKSLRGSVGAVGNISGAIGLYKTADLVDQVTKHSGQFGGEDQQRTAFVHLYGNGKGITYTDATVITKAPDTIKQLFRQRSFRWNLSLPELFFVYFRILITPRFHYLLKVEKAYQMYLLATDPVRMLFFWMVFFNPVQAMTLYTFYTVFTFIVWLKIGRKDPLWLIFIFPIYSLLESLCRFIAHFYWFKIKYHYLFEKKLHTLVTDRKLAWEYAGVGVVILMLWCFSIARAGMAAREASDVYMRKIVSYNKLVSPLTEDITQSTISQNNLTIIASAQPAVVSTASAEASASSSLEITADKGDGRTQIARKAVALYALQVDLVLDEKGLILAEDSMKNFIPHEGRLYPGQIVVIDKELVKNHVEYAMGK